MREATLTWSSGEEWIRLEVDGNVAFADVIDHWRNGVCRLLGLEENQARAWVEGATRAALERWGQLLMNVAADDAAEVLRAAFEEVIPPSPPRSLDLSGAPRILGRAPDRVFAPSLQDGLAVVGTRDLAWLVEAGSLSPPQAPTVHYDHSYFEGATTGVGYGGYLAQESWRLEKGRRFLRQVEAVGHYLGLHWGERPRLLDLGSGYGFFRRAAEEAGWRHEGVEFSAHAARVAEDLFGFPSFVGELEAYVPAHTFHVITMWDVLEHVADPVSLVKRARSLLLPGGVLFLRTPNLDALERQVFGSRYHSFKAEHLFYFGPDSLVEVLERAGFRVAFLTTESHLLQGFFLDRVHGWARLLRGSDFFAAAVDGTYSVTPS